MDDIALTVQLTLDLIIGAIEFSDHREIVVARAEFPIGNEFVFPSHGDTDFERELQSAMENAAEIQLGVDAIDLNDSEFQFVPKLGPMDHQSDVHGHNQYNFQEDDEELQNHNNKAKDWANSELSVIARRSKARAELLVAAKRDHAATKIQRCFFLMRRKCRLTSMRRIATFLSQRLVRKKTIARMKIIDSLATLLIDKLVDLSLADVAMEIFQTETALEAQLRLESTKLKGSAASKDTESVLSGSEGTLIAPDNTVPNADRHVDPQICGSTALSTGTSEVQLEYLYPNETALTQCNQPPGLQQYPDTQHSSALNTESASQDCNVILTSQHPVRTEEPVADTSEKQPSTQHIPAFIFPTAEYNLQPRKRVVLGGGCKPISSSGPSTARKRWQEIQRERAPKSPATLWPRTLQSLSTIAVPLSILDPISVDVPSAKVADSVAHLDFSVESISNLFFLEKHRSVEKLMLQVNKIASLDGIEFISGLRMISLADNLLTSIKSLERLKLLEFINCDSNRLEEVSLRSLPNLCTLSLCCNAISSISLVDCPRLRRLELFSNKLTKIDFGKHSHVSQLLYLNLGRNQLREVDTGLFARMVHLQTLILSHNALESFPALSLPCLGTLWLNGNKLTGRLSCVDTELPSLRKLYLQDNQLSAIDESVVRVMPHVSEADVSFNSMSEVNDLLPLTAWHLLETLHAGGNRWSAQDLQQLCGAVRQRGQWPQLKSVGGEPLTAPRSAGPSTQRIKPAVECAELTHLVVSLRMLNDFHLTMMRRLAIKYKTKKSASSDPAETALVDQLTERVCQRAVKVMAQLLRGEAADWSCLQIRSDVDAVPVVEEQSAAVPVPGVSSADTTASANAAARVADVRDAADIIINSIELPVADVQTAADVQTVSSSSSSAQEDATARIAAQNRLRETAAARLKQFLVRRLRRRRFQSLLRGVAFEDQELQQMNAELADQDWSWLESADVDDVAATSVDVASTPSTAKHTAVSSAATSSAALSVAVDEEADEEVQRWAKPMVYGDHKRRRPSNTAAEKLMLETPRTSQSTPPRKGEQKAVRAAEQKSALMEDWGIQDDALAATLLKRQKKLKKSQGRAGHRR